MFRQLRIKLCLISMSILIWFLALLIILVWPARGEVPKQTKLCE